MNQSIWTVALTDFEKSSIPTTTVEFVGKSKHNAMSFLKSALEEWWFNAFSRELKEEGKQLSFSEVSAAVSAFLDESPTNFSEWRLNWRQRRNGSEIGWGYTRLLGLDIGAYIGFKEVRGKLQFDCRDSRLNPPLKKSFILQQVKLIA